MAVNRHDKCYSLQYREPTTGLKYSFECWAANPAKRDEIMQYLDLVITCEPDDPFSKDGRQHRIYTWAAKSEKGFLKQIPRVLHHACFLGHFAAHWNDTSTIPHMSMMLSDAGIIHSIAHKMCFIDDDPNVEYSRDVIVNKMSQFEQYWPWLWPEDERDY